MWIGVTLYQKSYFPGLDLYPEWSVSRRHFPDCHHGQYLVKILYLVNITFISHEPAMALTIQLVLFKLLTIFFATKCCMFHVKNEYRTKERVQFICHGFRPFMHMSIHFSLKWGCQI